ncbi:alanine racemase [Sphingomonas cavernae]|uniref:Amino acid deaminase n=1 Tax=Sphingomonas cavernae TaxID=2320861 RepID=A0A418W7H3_9SPHN|nr:alanine racemase [Sphingomonas cavernae]RJF85958.1 amino acid deaminase [Sphingomonas cavernae]
MNLGDQWAAQHAALDWQFKALPAIGEPVALDAVGAHGWSILREDVMLPAAVLRTEALHHNSRWMRRFTELAGVRLAPHGKTTMSPALFDLQLADGAWGITAATPAHVRIYRQHGVRRILLANQLIGRQGVAYVAAEMARDPDFDFYCLVDSIAAVDALDAALVACQPGRPMQLLVELGITGGRSGARDDATAIAVARAVSASPRLSLRGVEAFEGILQGQGVAGEPGMRNVLDRMVVVAAACRAENLFDGVPILSAGGSSFFDVVTKTLSAAEPLSCEVVLRSGCYLVHDSGYYADLVERLIARSPEAAELGEGLRPALEVWAYVHSRPERGRVIAGLGRRDISDDTRMPKPLLYARPGDAQPSSLGPGHATMRLDDQHAYLDVPEDSPLQVGDLIAFGISHPCTTFDRWPALYLVDEARAIIGAIRTFF